LQDWQSTYKESMDAIQTDLKNISAAVKEKPDLLTAELKTKLSDARANLSLLTRDRSRGAHNLDFAMEIMSVASRSLNEVKAAVK